MNLAASTCAICSRAAVEAVTPENAGDASSGRTRGGGHVIDKYSVGDGLSHPVGDVLCSVMD